MKITNIEVIPLVKKLDKEFLGGTYKITNRNTIVTRVYCDNGVVGECYGGDEDFTQDRIVWLMREHLAPLLIGQDPRDVERHWERMFNVNVDMGNRALHVLDLEKRAILTQAIAAIDNALWDAIGKHYDTPVYKLLGGYTDKVPVIAIGGYVYPNDAGHKQLRDEIIKYKDLQLAGVKMKVGRLSVAQDVARAAAIRDAVGPDFMIAADANQAWTPKQALEFARLAAPLNIRWLEEPVRWHDQLDGLRAVREGTNIPVVAGQGEITRWGCRDLILHGRVNILNVDVTIAGGVTEWRRMAGMASAFDVQMAHHEESQVALHLLASQPHGLYVEIFPNPERDPLWYELLLELPVIKDGTMHLPSGAGFGLQLNPETIEKYRLRES